MTFPEALYTHLAAHAGLSALVGDRITPLERLEADDILPCVTYEIQIEPIHTFGTAPRVKIATVTLDGMGATDADALAVAEQIHAALEHYSGAMGTITVLGCLSQSESLTAERLEIGPTTIWTVPVSYTIHYRA